MTAGIQGASVSTAALFTGLGAADTIGQFSKSLSGTASIADFGKTSVASLLALSRPSVDVLVATGLGYSPESWTRTATDAFMRPEQDSVGVGFLNHPTARPSCVYDESSQQQDRFVCRLVLTTIATSYLVYYALSPNEILRLIALLLSIGGVSSDRIWRLTGKVSSMLCRSAEA